MISIVIPTLNEAQLLPATLEHLKTHSTPHEVIVVDAGSTDATLALAQAAGVKTLQSPHRGRAKQMNLGAAQATGDILLFLHADTLLPASALRQLEQAFADPQVAGGGFARRFQHPSLFLQWTCKLADWRGKWLGWFLGDQAMFARRSAFEQVGGFPEMRLFEDLELSRRLARHGKTILLQPPVLSSGRRFQARGAFQTTCSDCWLTCQYLWGKRF